MTSVIHVTEALAGGVLTSLSELVSAQEANGLRTTVVYVARLDTPRTETLREIFPPTTRLVDVAAGSQSSLRGLLRLARAARRLSREDPDAVIHLHSSLAGGICRLPGMGPAGMRRGRVFYSPHGYAFLREDVATGTQRFLEGVERLLGRRGTSILVSASEEQLARNRLGIRKTAVLANAVDAKSLQSVVVPREVADGARPIVAMVGRITYQKAPWRFARIAIELSDAAEFVWLGDGAAEDREKWIGRAPVLVTGWLARAELLAQLGNADLVCFPTLWEGMPLALLEAQAIGKPAVASNIVGNRDVIADGETGILADNDEALIDAVRRLVSDAQLRAEMGHAASARVEAHFDRDRLRHDALTIYEGGRSRRRRDIDRNDQGVAAVSRKQSA